MPGWRLPILVKPPSVAALAALRFSSGAPVALSVPRSLALRLRPGEFGHLDLHVPHLGIVVSVQVDQRRRHVDQVDSGVLRLLLAEICP